VPILQGGGDRQQPEPATTTTTAAGPSGLASAEHTTPGWPRPDQSHTLAPIGGLLRTDEYAEGVAVKHSPVVVEGGHDATLGVVLARGDHARAGARRSGGAWRVDVAPVEGSQRAASREALVRRGKRVLVATLATDRRAFPQARLRFVSMIVWFVVRYSGAAKLFPGSPDAWAPGRARRARSVRVRRRAVGHRGSIPIDDAADPPRADLLAGVALSHRISLNDPPENPAGV
jgi:hypothetical protein